MNLSDADVRTMLLKIEYEIARQKMTKREFYEKSGVSSSLYSQWNTGTAKPTMKSIGRVAEALNLPVEFLVGGKTEEDKEEEMAEELQILRDREDLKALLHVGKRNTPEQIRRLIAMLESMNEG